MNYLITTTLRAAAIGLAITLLAPIVLDVRSSPARESRKDVSGTQIYGFSVSDLTPGETCSGTNMESVCFARTSDAFLVNDPDPYSVGTVELLAGHILTGAPALLPSAASATSVLYTGGYWYVDGDFERRDVMTRDGEIAPLSSAPDHVVDLTGAYIVPGFAEAHHHTVLCNSDRIEQFIAAGITYAGVLNATVSSRQCQAEFHPRSGLELMNALAGVTGPSAHPSQIGLNFLEADEVEGEWVHSLASLDELEFRWPEIEATHPDILKIFLSYSEDFDHLSGVDSIPPWYKGLDPEIVSPLVARAHEAGLRVVAHVMSAHDFEVAVDAGVDMIGHMPGFAPYNAFTPSLAHPWFDELRSDDERYKISTGAAELAASRGVMVMTTVSGTGIASAAVRHNFELLQKAGTDLLVGSDRGEFNAVDEATWLVKQDLMTAGDALHSLAVTTPRALFPERSIGKLTIGYEASFVVLGGNPLNNFAEIRRVSRVVKLGETIFEGS